MTALKTFFCGEVDTNFVTSSNHEVPNLLLKTSFIFTGAPKKEIYFVALIDVLTHYGVKKQVSLVYFNLFVTQARNVYSMGKSKPA